MHLFVEYIYKTFLKKGIQSYIYIYIYNIYIYIYISYYTNLNLETNTQNVSLLTVQYTCFVLFL